MAGELPNFTDDFRREDEASAVALQNEQWMSMLERVHFARNVKPSIISIQEFELAVAAACIQLDERLRKRPEGL